MSLEPKPVLTITIDMDELRSSPILWRRLQRSADEGTAKAMALGETEMTNTGHFHRPFEREDKLIIILITMSNIIATGIFSVFAQL